MKKTIITLTVMIFLWPNIIIYEGVKGMGSRSVTDRATHDTTIPFTMMLTGPVDYSVCHFGERRQNATWVHQVAIVAIYCLLTQRKMKPSEYLQNNNQMTTYI